MTVAILPNAPILFTSWYHIAVPPRTTECQPAGPGGVGGEERDVASILMFVSLGLQPSR